MTSYAQITAASERIGARRRITPLLSSPFLDKIAGRRVFVKAECLQHTGSFKFRGAWSAVSALSDDDRERGVIAFSSGNHAQGVALAARGHGVPAVIVMPSDAPAIKFENTRALGAEVVLYHRDAEKREDVADRVNHNRRLSLIKPYDNAQVIAGQGTTGLEIAIQARDAGVTKADVLVNCGGGGLTSGIALALEQDAPDMVVRPVEPQGFDDVAKSLATGEIQSNPHMSGSICDAIITPSPGEITFPILKRLCGAGIAVSDDECLRAMALAFERLRIVIEPGGAASLAAALFYGDTLTSENIIAVATGGNVDATMFTQALTKYRSNA